jgi:hypothetical protein
MRKSILAKKTFLAAAWHILLTPDIDGLIATIFNVCPIHANSPTNQLVCQVHLEHIASQVLAQVFMPRVGLLTGKHFDDTIHSMQDAIEKPVEDAQVETVRLQQHRPICCIPILVVHSIHVV